MKHGEFGTKSSEGLLGHINSSFETHVQIKLNHLRKEEEPQNIGETTAHTGNTIFGWYLKEHPKNVRESPQCHHRPNKEKTLL